MRIGGLERRKGGRLIPLRAFLHVSNGHAIRAPLEVQPLAPRLTNDDNRVYMEEKRLGEPVSVHMFRCDCVARLDGVCARAFLEPEQKGSMDLLLC